MFFSFKFYNMRSLSTLIAIVIVFVAVSAPSVSAQQSTAAEQTAVLLDISQQLQAQGTPATCFSTWRSGTDPCRRWFGWKGVTCNSSTGNVTSLGLFSCGLVGALPAASISKLKLLQTLSVRNNPALTALAPAGAALELPALRTLYAYSCGLRGDLQALRSLPSLVHLEVDNNSNLTSLAGIGNNAKLQKLYAYSCDLVDVQALVPLMQLSYVNVGKNPRLRSLAGVASPKLTHLYAYSCDLRGDLQALAPLTQLSYVRIADNPRLRSLAGLQGSNGTMAEVNALGCNLTDVDALAPLTRLTSVVVISNPRLASLAGIENCSRLTRLVADNCSISDLSPLSNLTLLDTLFISKNRISDLAPLANLTRLRSLSADYNQISSLEPLSNLPVLDLIYLDFNRIQSVRGLGAGVRYLHVSNNNINSFSGFEHLVKLKLLDISNNNFRGAPLPSSWSFPRLYSLFASRASIGGALPSWSRSSMPLMNVIDLRFNKFTNKLIPSSWASLRLDELDLSGNCIVANSSLLSGWRQRGAAARMFDFSPDCLQPRAPLLSDEPLASGYRFFDANPGSRFCEWELSGTKCNGIPFSIAITKRVSSLLFIFRINCRTSTPLSFDSNCFTAIYRVQLECFRDAAATQPCDAATMQRLRLPSWHNKTVEPAPSLSGNYRVDMRDTQLLFGLHYRLRFEMALNAMTSALTPTQRQNYPSFSTTTTFSDTFQGSGRCLFDDSIAIVGSRTCATCPTVTTVDGRGTQSVLTCNGTAGVLLGDTPAWRPAAGLLPFIACPAGVTRGCLSRHDRNASAPTAELIDGSHCRPNYDEAHPLCLRCVAGFGMIDGECEQCPAPGGLIALFALGVLVFVVFATLFIYMSLRKAELDQRFIEGEDERREDICILCCAAGHASQLDITELECFRPLANKLEQWRPQLERLVIALRQLINHVSFVGALAGTASAVEMGAAFRAVLDINMATNSFAFGGLAATLSCLMPHGWSAAVLQFNLIWIVFASVFVFECVLFFAWKRKVTAAASVVLFLSFVAYAPLTNSAAKLLSLCRDFNFYDASEYLLHSGGGLRGVAPAKTYSLLASDLAQECSDDFTSGSVVGAALTIAVFSLGVPLGVVAVHRCLEKRKMLRDEMLGFLTQHVRPEAWFYELLVMGRKLLVALAIGVFPAQAALQLTLFTVVAGAMLGLSVLVMPFETKAANRAEQLSISSAMLTATLMSCVTAFEGDTGVAAFASIGVIVVQVVAVLGIVVFGHGTAKSDVVGEVEQTLLEELAQGDVCELDRELLDLDARNEERLRGIDARARLAHENVMREFYEILAEIERQTQERIAEIHAAKEERLRELEARCVILRRIIAERQAENAALREEIAVRERLEAARAARAAARAAARERRRGRAGG